MYFSDWSCSSLLAKIELLLNSLPPRAYLTKRLPHAERFREWAAKRKKYFLKKITAGRVFKIKSSFLAPFLVNGWILSCNHQKWKIMSFSYLNIELYYSAIDNFHKSAYIYCMVCITAKATDFNYFFLKSTLKSDQFDVWDFIKRPKHHRENIITKWRINF